jgi:hypothetical protein
VPIALAIAALLALRLAGCGFEGDPLEVLTSSPDRLSVIADRRGPVIGVTLLAWLVAFGLSLAVDRSRAGRLAARLLALSLVYLPLVLLATAALEPSIAAEQLLAMLGPPALAALTLIALNGYRALAFACGATVLAYSVDLIAGSPLSRFSLVGPNPAAGHRFYGVGNELEAILVVLVLVGTGAALSSFAPLQGGKSRTRGAGAFVLVAATFAFVFAYGRYGADVGAAIVLPLGGAVAAALLLDRPRLALLAFALPLPALTILAGIDLITSANSHLTSTVLQAESGGDVFAVLGRRLREAGESFGRPVLLAGLPVVLAAALAAWFNRNRLAAWLQPYPPIRAALLGALAATVVGTIANDSGALLLEIGAAYLLVFVGYGWAESRSAVGDPEGRYP